MLLLGSLWCGFFALLQGDTPWEPNDKGWFTGWALQYVVIGDLLLFLWSKRARAGVIVGTPIVIQLLALAFAWNDTGSDGSDTSTFADGFLDVVPPMIVAVAVTAAAIGLCFVVQRRRSRLRGS